MRFVMREWDGWERGKGYLIIRIISITAMHCYRTDYNARWVPQASLHGQYLPLNVTTEEFTRGEKCRSLLSILWLGVWSTYSFYMAQLYPLSPYQSTNQPLNTSVSLPIYHLFIYYQPPLYSHVCVSIFLSICLSIYRSMYVCIYLSIYLSIYLVRLFTTTQKERVLNNVELKY